MDKQSIDQLAQKLAEAVPQGLKSVGNDLEKNFRALLNSGISKLDLVSREEFDVQQAVLARTREILEKLEQRLQSLEASDQKAAAGSRAKVAKKAPQKAAKKTAKETAKETTK